MIKSVYIPLHKHSCHPADYYLSNLGFKMQFSALLLFSIAALASSVSVSRTNRTKTPISNYHLSSTAARDHKLKLIISHQANLANCNDKNDCCFNNYDGCRNQGLKRKTCKNNDRLCSKFKTDKAHGEVVPSCDGADCCVISTGLGGSCY